MGCHRHHQPVTTAVGSERGTFAGATATGKMRRFPPFAASLRRLPPAAQGRIVSWTTVDLHTSGGRYIMKMAAQIEKGRLGKQALRIPRIGGRYGPTKDPGAGRCSLTAIYRRKGQNSCEPRHSLQTFSLCLAAAERARQAPIALSTSAPRLAAGLWPDPCVVVLSVSTRFGNCSGSGQDRWPRWRIASEPPPRYRPGHS
jgi:hypothetical protein